MTLKIDSILNDWQKSNDIWGVSKDVPDWDVWLMAILAAAVAGKRAQDIGDNKREEACARFVALMDSRMKKIIKKVMKRQHD